MKENVMGTKPVFPLLMSMSFPPMISMLIQSMYNVVDSYFVAKISQDALTAVSLAFPLQNLALAVAVGFGVSVNACVARGMGAGKEEMVHQAATLGLVCTAVHGIIFVFLGLFAAGPFLSMFTEDPKIYEMSLDYSRIVICFTFGSFFHIYIEKLFQATGDMVVPMILQAVGALINIILDPILILGLWGFPAMGVTGAAVATIIGQMAACGLAVLMFIRKNNGIRISFRGFVFDGKLLGQLYAVAVPSGVMLSLPSVLVGILNTILMPVSQAAVAVLGLYIKLQAFIYMPANGVIQGMRPIISYNYGSGNMQRVRKTLVCSFLTVAAILAAGTLLFFFFPEFIVEIFSKEEEMLAIGGEAFRIISLGFVCSAVGVVASGAFEAFGKGLLSLIVSAIRQLLVIPPLTLLLMGSLGLAGVWLTFPLAELAAAFVGGWLLWRFLRVRMQS